MTEGQRITNTRSSVANPDLSLESSLIDDTLHHDASDLALLGQKRKRKQLSTVAFVPSPSPGGLTAPVAMQAHATAVDTDGYVQTPYANLYHLIG